VKAVVDADLADAVFVGQLHAALHGVESDWLAELVPGVPDF